MTELMDEQIQQPSSQQTEDVLIEKYERLLERCARQQDTILKQEEVIAKLQEELCAIRLTLPKAKDDFTKYMPSPVDNADSGLTIANEAKGYASNTKPHLYNWTPFEKG